MKISASIATTAALALIGPSVNGIAVDLLLEEASAAPIL